MISKLFSSKKVVDSAISGVDKAFFTKEEKMDVFQKLLVLYEPYKLAQRILAIVFCVPWVLSWSAVVISSFFGFDTSKISPLLGGQMGNIVLTIAAFYFGGGALEGLIKASKK